MCSGCRRRSGRTQRLQNECATRRMPGRRKREGWVGFRFAMRGHFSDYRDTAIRGLGWKPACRPTAVYLSGRRVTARSSRCPISADAGAHRVQAGSFRRRNHLLKGVEADRIGGGVALVCHSGELPRGRPPCGRAESSKLR